LSSSQNVQGIDALELVFGQVSSFDVSKCLRNLSSNA
jgi:hypothetical protein